MVEFFNTGIDTEYLTFGIVAVTLIISIILPLTIYHLQKIRPKLKIRSISAYNYPEDRVGIKIEFKNIGHIVAEDTKYEIESKTKGIAISKKKLPSSDLMPNENRFATEDVFIKSGEKCKIKLKISWNNHTFLLKKRDNLSKEFTCERKGEQWVVFD